MRPPLRWIAAWLIAVPSVSAASGAPPRGAVEGTLRPLAAEDERLLDRIQHDAFRYFLDQADPATGLVADASRPGAPASIAATGFGLAALCIGESRGWISHDEAYARVFRTLSTVRKRLAHERGFYYHFVDPATGARVWSSEASSIDTALLLAGALTAAQHFEGTEIELLGNYLYRRTEWPWMMTKDGLLSMGWKPEQGFLSAAWDWYNEGILLYALALSSPTHPIPPDAWHRWRRAERVYAGTPVIYSYFGSLFTYQYAQAYIDFRHLYDGSVNYWQNSVNAAAANRQFCRDQAAQHAGYREGYWGLTAGNGPSGYRGYGAEPAEVALHDGTINPYGMIAALPFDAAAALDALKALLNEHGERIYGEYGFRSGFNLDQDWWSRQYLGIDQGISVLMIENVRSGRVWDTFMRNPYIRQWLGRCMAREPAPKPPGS